MKKLNVKNPVKRPNSQCWEGTICPCGGKKERETMLCAACVEHFQKERPSLFDYLDVRVPLEARRSSAIILCSLARKRKAIQPQRGLPLAFNVV
jgi:hypothetical protein